MLFNIKNWQDKHLIKESKLKEMDFKDKAAFDKYQSKHKMRSTTKVSIAGKDTTAGEAGGGEEKAIFIQPGGGEKKQASGKSGKSVSDPIPGKSLLDKMMTLDYSADGTEELDQLLQDTGAFDKEELTYEDGMKAIQDLDNYQDGKGVYNDEDEAHDAKLEMQDQLTKLFDEPEGGWNKDNKGNVKADGSEHEYGELDRYGATAPQNQYSDDDDNYGDTDEDGFTDEDRVLNALDAFRDGTIDKDEWDAIRDEYDEDDEYSDELGYGEEQAPKAPKEKGEDYIPASKLTADNVGDYDKSWAGEFSNDPSTSYNKDTAKEILSKFEEDGLVDGEDFEVNFADGTDFPVSIRPLNKKAKERTEYKSTVYSDNPGKWSRLPKKPVTSGEHTFTGLDSSYHAPKLPKEFLDDVKKELEQTYKFDDYGASQLDKLYNRANADFAKAATKAKKAGQEPPSATAFEFAKRIERSLNYQNKVKDGVTLKSKKESVTPRSARIQEAKMYRTIQELKGLEKGL